MIIRLKSFSLFLIFAVNLTANGAPRPPKSSNDCQLSLRFSSETLAQTKELFSFLIFNHPAQHAAVDSLESLVGVYYWVHWSAGFMLSTNPRLMNPEAKGFRKNKSNYWSLFPSRSYARSGDEYLAKRRSYDQFPKFLIQDEWEARPRALTKQLDNLMQEQADDFVRINEGFSVLNLDSEFRGPDTTKLIAGIQEGFDYLRNLNHPSRFLTPIDRAAILPDHPEVDAFLNRLGLILANEQVGAAIKIILDRYLPIVTQRRLDFDMGDRIAVTVKDFDGYGERIYLLNFKIFIGRRTEVLNRLINLQTDLFKAETPNVNAPVVKQKLPVPLFSLVDVEDRARRVTGETVEEVTSQSVNELVRIGGAGEKRFAEIVNTLMSLSTVNDRIYRTWPVPSDQELAPRVAQLIENVQKLKDAGERELVILSHLQQAYAKNQRGLTQVLSALAAQLTAAPNLSPHEIAEADHLQEVVLTMAPTPDVLVARGQSTMAKLDLIRNTLRNLYAFQLEQAAFPNPETSERLNDILRALSDGLGGLN